MSHSCAYLPNNSGQLYLNGPVYEKDIEPAAKRETLSGDGHAEGGKIGRRKVLFTDKTSPNMILVITDAPKEKIEEFCVHYSQGLEDGEKTFDFLKKSNYVNILFDSDFHIDNEDIDIIGYDEMYELIDYITMPYDVSDDEGIEAEAEYYRSLEVPPFPSQQEMEEELEEKRKHELHLLEAERYDEMDAWRRRYLLYIENSFSIVNE